MQNLIKMVNEGVDISVATHNGIFHSDELFLLAIIKVFITPCSVIRTRAEDKILEADIVIDVGGQFIPEELKFDHHQFKRKDPIARECALTLFLREAKKNGIEIHMSHIQEDIVEAVRARDTRVQYDKENKYEDILEAISRSNSIDPYGDEQEHQFKKILGFIMKYFSTNNIVEFRKNIFLEAESNSLIYDQEMKDRFSELSIIEVKDGINIYRHPLDKYVDTKLFNNKAFILINYDEGHDNYTVSVNTDFCIIEKISEKVFIHPNGFMAKSNSRNPKFQLKLVHG